MRNIISSTHLRLAILTLFIAISTSVSAATISFEATNISGNTWELNYSVTNDTLGSDINEFSIYYAAGLYENIVAVSSPTDWDPLVLQPDHFLPAPGLYDSLALGTGIAPGQTLGGFVVRFDYLGAVPTVSQYFTVVDPDTFDTLEDGNIASTLVTIPLPAAAWLFIGGLSFLSGVGRGSSRRKLA